VPVAATHASIAGRGTERGSKSRAVRRLKSPAERVAFFESVERRFAWQARGTTLLVGSTGFYLTHAWDLWQRFTNPACWWMHAMVAVWAIFTVMLFIAEPLFLHRWFLASAERDPERTFRRIERLHWVLLAVSLVTVVGTVAGVHGWLV
jgi:uncharacterized membrane protein